MVAGSRWFNATIQQLLFFYKKIIMAKKKTTSKDEHYWIASIALSAINVLIMLYSISRDKKQNT